MAEENETFETTSGEIPRDMVDLVQAEDTALKISEICVDNGVEDEKQVAEISYQVARILLGNLSPDEFKKSLIERAKLSTFLATKISREITESIFSKVKESLASLYKTEVSSSEKTEESITTPSAVKSSLEEKPKGPDVYRETAE